MEIVFVASRRVRLSKSNGMEFMVKRDEGKEPN